MIEPGMPSPTSMPVGEGTDGDQHSSMTPIQIIGEHRPSKSQDFAGEHTINWYLQPKEFIDSWTRRVSKLLEQDWCLYPTPGLTTFSVINPSTALTVRALLTVHNRTFCVIGTNFIEVFNDGTTTIRGSILTNIGVCTLTATNSQILILDGNTPYLFTTVSNTYAQITDVNFPTGALYAAAQDGYLVAVAPNTNEFFVSKLNDGSVWDHSLGIAFASFTSGNIVNMISAFEDLYIFKQDSIEIWDNVAGSNSLATAQQPFVRRAGAVYNYALAAPQSLCQSALGLLWLGTTKNGGVQPYYMTGYQVNPIFNPGIIAEMNGLTTTSDAIGWVEQTDEHEFYILTFPTEDVTYVWDLTFQVSHVRNTFYTDSNIYGRWRPNFYTYNASFNKKIVGDWQSGTLYLVDENTYTDVGAPIRRERRTQILNKNNMYKTIYKLFLNFETASALSAGQGQNPIVMLTVSHDGGHTWGNEMTRPVASNGTFYDQSSWEMLGAARKHVANIAVTDPIKWILIGGTAMIGPSYT